MTPFEMAMTSHHTFVAVAVIVVAVVIGVAWCDELSLRFQDEAYVVKEEKFSKVNVVVNVVNYEKQFDNSIICKVSNCLGISTRSIRELLFISVS